MAFTPLFYYLKMVYNTPPRTKLAQSVLAENRERIMLEKKNNTNYSWCISKVMPK
jgi:hypothetical protein